MSGLSGTSVWRPQSRYTVSRIECRIKFPQNQRCRAKISLHPPKSRGCTFSPDPPSHFPCLICSRQGPGGGPCRGRLLEGIAALLGSENGSRYKGGVAATVTPIALHCATKRLETNCPRAYPLTRNYYKNNSLRIIFRNFEGISCSRNVQERKTFSRNYA